MQSDPRGYEILASKLIREKEKSAPKTSSTISLETAAPGHQMTLNKPQTRSAKRALFIDSPIPATEFLDLKSSARFLGLFTKI